jgi:hypothetical protein
MEHAGPCSEGLCYARPAGLGLLALAGVFLVAGLALVALAVLW